MSNLLVIGNGFDLSLKAKTSYPDFFNSKFYSDYKKAAYGIINFFKVGGRFFLEAESCKITCWDILFCLKSENDEKIKNWCDVERVIADSSMISRSYFA